MLQEPAWLLRMVRERIATQRRLAQRAARRDGNGLLGAGYQVFVVQSSSLLSRIARMPQTHRLLIYACVFETILLFTYAILSIIEAFKNARRLFNATRLACPAECGPHCEADLEASVGELAIAAVLADRPGASMLLRARRSKVRQAAADAVEELMGGKAGLAVADGAVGVGGRRLDSFDDALETQAGVIAPVEPSDDGRVRLVGHYGTTFGGMDGVPPELSGRQRWSPNPVGILEMALNGSWAALQIRRPSFRPPEARQVAATARVACQQLGFGHGWGALRPVTEDYPNGLLGLMQNTSSMAWSERVYCQGNETSFAACEGYGGLRGGTLGQDKSAQRVVVGCSGFKSDPGSNLLSYYAVSDAATDRDLSNAEDEYGCVDHSWVVSEALPPELIRAENYPRPSTFTSEYPRRRTPFPVDSAAMGNGSVLLRGRDALSPSERRALEAWSIYGQTLCGLPPNCAALSLFTICASQTAEFFIPLQQVCLSLALLLFVKRALLAENTPHLVACVVVVLISWCYEMSREFPIEPCTGRPYRSAGLLGIEPDGGVTKTALYWIHSRLLYGWGIVALFLALQVAMVHRKFGWLTFSVVGQLRLSLASYRLLQWHCAATEWSVFLYVLAVASEVHDTSFYKDQNRTAAQVYTWIALTIDAVVIFLCWRFAAAFTSPGPRCCSLSTRRRRRAALCFVYVCGLMLLACNGVSLMRLDRWWFIELHFTPYVVGFVFSLGFRLLLIATTTLVCFREELAVGYSPELAADVRTGAAETGNRPAAAHAGADGLQLPPNIAKHVRSGEEEESLRFCVGGVVMTLVGKDGKASSDCFLQLSADMSSIRWSWKDMVLVDELTNIIHSPARPLNFRVYFSDAVQQTDLDLTFLCRKARHAQHWVTALDLLQRAYATAWGLGAAEHNRLKAAFRSVSSGKGVLSYSQQQDFFACLNRSISQEELRRFHVIAGLPPGWTYQVLEETGEAFFCNPATGEQLSESEGALPRTGIQNRVLARRFTLVRQSSGMLSTVLEATRRGSTKIASSSWWAMLRLFVVARRQPSLEARLRDYGHWGTCGLELSLDEFIAFWRDSARPLAPESASVCPVTEEAQLAEEGRRLFEGSCGAGVHGAGARLTSCAVLSLLVDVLHNGWVDPTCLSLHQDMDQPLSSYYIRSSHNTFLTGNQLTSDSSSDMYRRALMMGVRCVEIDVFDGIDGELKVYHKYSYTSQVTFRSVLDAVAETAFPSAVGGPSGRASVFPVILSLECHCSLEGQERIAAELVEVFGDRLHRESDATQETPAALHGKVIVKGKKGSSAQAALFGSVGIITATRPVLAKNASSAASLGSAFDDSSSEEDADELSSRLGRPLLPPPLDRCGASTSALDIEESSSEMVAEMVAASFPRHVATPPRSSLALGRHLSPGMARSSRNSGPSAVQGPPTPDSPTSEVPRGGITSAKVPSLLKELSWSSRYLMFKGQAVSSPYSADGLGGKRFKRTKSKARPKVSPGLSAVTTMRSVRFGGFEKPSDDPAAKRPLVVSSFKETRGLEMERESQAEWIVHNQERISRVYPRGGRLDSSNISELHVCRLWGTGVQMVALNIQTWDATAMLDQARFALNGGCGYVLKPELQPRGAQLTHGVLLKLRIICASNLPKGRDERIVARPWDEWHAQGSFGPTPLQPAGVVSPACEVEFIGGLLGSEESDALEERWSRTTATVADNGLNPSWADECFSCACYTPEQTFIKLSVYNCRRQVMRQGSKQLLAYEAALVGALRPGYRAVQLRCPNSGSPIESSTLLVHLEMTPLPPRDGGCTAAGPSTPSATPAAAPSSSGHRRWVPPGARTATRQFSSLGPLARANSREAVTTTSAPSIAPAADNERQTA
jgi:hypothetical protein